MALTEGINIELLHGRVVERLAASFPAMGLIRFDYERTQKKMPTPAILLELTQFEPAEDMGTGQLHGICRFEAHCITRALQNPDSAVDVRTLAIALAGYIHHTRWGTRQAQSIDPYAETDVLPVGPARILGCFPDAWYPDMDQHDVWRVEWEQAVYLGDSAWVTSGQIPTAIYVNENVVPYPEDYLPPSTIFPPINPGAGSGGNSTASAWHTGDGPPPAGLGKKNDFYLDGLTGDFYEKTDSTTWTLAGNIRGPQGEIGPQGEEGPPGQDGTGDSTYSVSFVDVSSVVVTHNLGKYPAVVFKDTAGTVYEIDIEHNSTNQLTAQWSQPLSGTITCN